jgi:hypothetical protein
MTRRLVQLLMLLAFPVALDAQDPPPPPPATTAAGSLRVFVDNCPCSLDYLRTEVPYIDYMRDRADADVHLLFGYQGTGAGGTAFTMYFIGLRGFAGTSDTLRFSTQPSETEDQTRQTMVRYMKMGLMRYVARTSAADRIRISLAPAVAGAAAAAAPVNDPWNYWVFRLGVNGGGNGEKSRTRISGGGSLTATRTTEKWKTRLNSNGNYSESKLTIPTSIDTTFADDGGVESVDTTLSSIEMTYSHSIFMSGYVARSLGQHFSTGAITSGSASSFSNNDLFLRFAPALEYSLFPYSESTRRQLFFTYSVGWNVLDYSEETIYFKTKEQVLDHQIQVLYEMTQPWGSAFGGLTGQQYLHDTHLYAASAYIYADIRLFKGFSLNFNGNASTIYNQISIQRSGLSERDVLLNRRQQATTYRVNANFGISYTFGSIFNNIVNPRFNGTGDSIQF